MMLENWLSRALLLLAAIFPAVLGAFIGIDIRTDVSNMPPASKIVSILKANRITHVRLFNADANMLKALANTSIEVIVGVTNGQLLRMGRSPSDAAQWINQNVASYMPQTNITAIAVGSEVLTSLPHEAPILLPAMNNLHQALVAANLNFKVKVSTPHSMDVISTLFPPSTAIFNSSWNNTMYMILQFLKNTDSYFMVNAYPYYGYAQGNGIFPLEYALFQPLSSVEQIVDPNTLHHYNSMFDAMVDATYYAIGALEFSGIPVVVTETGWPWRGSANETDATVQNADTYVNNLITRVLNNSGPPSQPNMPINTYIYDLFDEDEQNWSLFFTNGSAVHSLSLDPGNSSSVFCVSKAGANADKLKSGLNWACGEGHANCSAIQQGQPCYNPNNLESHAAYAYNDYYQRMQSVGGTCDFDGTAIVTTTDPSYGSCVFTGSSKSKIDGSGFSPASLGPVSPVIGGENSRSGKLYVEVECLAVGMLLLWFCL